VQAKAIPTIMYGNFGDFDKYVEDTLKQDHMSIVNHSILEASPQP
jgi:hypothetical protein